MNTNKILIGLLSLMAVTEVTYADVNLGNKIASADEIKQVFKSGNVNTGFVSNSNDDYEGDIPTGQIRGLGKMHKVSVLDNQTKSKTSSSKPALSMEITFGYNSAELTTSGIEHLKPLGEALASESLQNKRFIVEGHTDAIGGETYNINLSEERAASVKAYLANAYQISPSRIEIIGKGKDGLLDPTHPDSEVNRRVRIVALN